MKLLKILGYDYEVRFSPLHDEGGNTDAGRANMFRQKIFIDSTMHEQCQQSTLLHEAIELMGMHMELNLDHKTVVALECGLYQFLKDNGVDLDILMEGI